MSRCVNAVFLLGNLGMDPSLKMTSGGKALSHFSVATTDRYKKGEEWVETTQWHRCTLWGQQAEFLSKNAAKGDRVHVTGEIRYSESTGEDGVKRNYTEIHVHEVVLLGKWQGDGRPGAPTQRGKADGSRQNRGRGRGEVDGDDSGDDIPF